MPEMTIELRRDPETGKSLVVVGLRGDEDLLHHEHEALHRQLVERLLAAGVLNDDTEVGDLLIERERAERNVGSPPGQVQPRERSALSEGE